jgi:uncharacterized protein YndB with AHSA1/START domain
MTEPNIPHRIEVDLEIAASADAVWRAITTSGGISSWMMETDSSTAVPDTVEVGDVLTFHMGPEFDSPAEVVEVDQHRRFAYEEDWASLTGHTGAEVTPLLTEFLIEAKSGDTCTVRVVTSAFGVGAEWENEFFSEMEVGWVPMLENLKRYVESFPDQTASTMWLDAHTPVAPERAIDVVRARLGADAVGDAAEVGSTAGTLERSEPRSVLLRLSAPVGGFVSIFTGGDGETAGLHLIGHIFGDDAADYVESERATWQAWLDSAASDATAATA